MGLMKMLAAPVRRLLNFPLFQLVLAIAVILLLQAADSSSVFGEAFNGLDLLVDSTVRLCAALFEVKSFTRSWLTAGFMIAYVYLAGLLIIFVMRTIIRGVIELAARVNLFGLTNSIARERGIAAYRAWLPLERIRPPHIPQEKWEEKFAWPADGRPPYPPLIYRMLRTAFGYLFVVGAIAVLLQTFTPFPVLTWMARAARRLVGI
jgi:hypothetical protein